MADEQDERRARGGLRHVTRRYRPARVTASARRVARGSRDRPRLWGTSAWYTLTPLSPEPRSTTTEVDDENAGAEPVNLDPARPLELEFHTFSIVARCPRTGDFGVAVATARPAVGAVVPWVSARGAIATQAKSNTELGRRALALIDATTSASTTTPIPSPSCAACTTSPSPTRPRCWSSTAPTASAAIDGPRAENGSTGCTRWGARL